MTASTHRLKTGFHQVAVAKRTFACFGRGSLVHLSSIEFFDVASEPLCDLVNGSMSLLCSITVKSIVEIDLLITARDHKWPAG